MYLGILSSKMKQTTLHTRQGSGYLPIYFKNTTEKVTVFEK